MPSAIAAALPAQMPQPKTPPSRHGTPYRALPPSRMRDYRDHDIYFRSFLETRGAELLANKDGIILSFRTDRGLGTIWHGPVRLLWWNMEAERAWAAFRNKSIPWRATPTGDGVHKRKKRLLQTLAQRDGSRCIYCWTPLSERDATIEHFVPRTAGGTSHISNLGLACMECNTEMSCHSVAQKITCAIRGTII